MSIVGAPDARPVNLHARLITHNTRKSGYYSKSALTRIDLGPLQYTSSRNTRPRRIRSEDGRRGRSRAIHLVVRCDGRSCLVQSRLLSVQDLRQIGLAHPAVRSDLCATHQRYAWIPFAVSLGFCTKKDCSIADSTSLLAISGSTLFLFRHLNSSCEPSEMPSNLFPVSTHGRLCVIPLHLFLEPGLLTKK